MARQKDKVIIKLDGTQRQDAVRAIQGYLNDQFELELGYFEAEEALDFCIQQFGPLFYNRAIFDVQTQLKERFESIESDIWALEKS